jgi:hypothetical protein
MGHHPACITIACFIQPLREIYGNMGPKLYQKMCVNKTSVRTWVPRLTETMAPHTNSPPCSWKACGGAHESHPWIFSWFLRFRSKSSFRMGPKELYDLCNLSSSRFSICLSYGSYGWGENNSSNTRGTVFDSQAACLSNQCQAERKPQIIKALRLRNGEFNHQPCRMGLLMR